MKSTSAVAALAALAQDTRLAVFRLLVQQGPSGLAAGEIAASLAIRPATLSFHLKELARARLVRARQQGRFIYYSADFASMNGLLAFLTENCCAADGGAGACGAGRRLRAGARGRAASCEPYNQGSQGMKRFHVHVSVADLDQSIRFYSTLFGAQPAVQKPDYAKWMLEDPRINFAISSRGGKPGLDHLGLQADSDAELEALHANLQRADVAAQEEKGIGCCYAVSNKYWVTDPTGLAWETFHTLGSVPTFNGAQGEGEAAAACCAPVPAVKVSVAIPMASAKNCCG